MLKKIHNKYVGIIEIHYHDDLLLNKCDLFTTIKLTSIHNMLIYNNGNINNIYITNTIAHNILNLVNNLKLISILLLCVNLLYNNSILFIIVFLQLMFLLCTKLLLIRGNQAKKLSKDEILELILNYQKYVSKQSADVY